MSLFFTHLQQYAFLQHAVLAGVLTAIACGIVGSYVVVRRSTYTAGAIAHCVLGGMGIARYLHHVHGMTWATPLTGATLAAILAASIIAGVTASGKQREDTVLSAVWAVGMAIGISFISITPGYYEDLLSYLFGNILMVGMPALRLMAVLDLFIIVITILFYNQFLAVSFQPELARLRGVSVQIYHTLILLITALTVVLLTQVVGLILVIALLTLPAAMASRLVHKLWLMMLVAAALSLVFTIGGIALSYGPELPAGATIIELTGSAFVLLIGGQGLYHRWFRHARSHRKGS
ncbi:metal ABC transporter permease [bacterium]|nr:metal ABC transporter permease [candidate division CSSED10-310 bacterium]